MADKKKTVALPQPGFFHRLRTYFLTGLVVAAPIGITVYLIWWFVSFFDQWIKPYIPSAYNPDNYLPFSVPGVGLLLALFGITVIGAFTANLFGRTIINLWERLLSGMPVVRTVYSALKQIFETVLSQKSDSFREVCLIEYPRKGLYAIAFVSCDSEGEVPARAKAGDLISVFLPTTPNPTSGFLLFVPERDVIKLTMTVEEAAKLVISAGLVVPDHEVGAEAPDHYVPQITEETAQEILKAQAKNRTSEEREKNTSDAAE
ncbi:MAG: DUF502 domain-containing protein [Hyphomicrobiales bacterium]